MLGIGGILESRGSRVVLLEVRCRRVPAVRGGRRGIIFGTESEVRLLCVVVARFVVVVGLRVVGGRFVVVVPGRCGLDGECDCSVVILT